MASYNECPINCGRYTISLVFSPWHRHASFNYMRLSRTGALRVLKAYGLCLHETRETIGCPATLRSEHGLLEQSILYASFRMGLLDISFPWQIQAQEETAIISWRECSKKSVQQGRSIDCCVPQGKIVQLIPKEEHLCVDARSVHGVCEHGKMARTLLAVFSNIPRIYASFFCQRSVDF